MLTRSLIAFVGVFAATYNIAQAGDNEDIWCRLSLKKTRAADAEVERAPCQPQVISKAKFFTEEYQIGSKKVTVERIEEAKGAEPFKVKVNGKIGTMQEENRYAFDFKSDDLLVEFSFDAVLPDKKHTIASLQGVWHENTRSGCHADDPGTIVVKGITVTKDGGETSCKIYKIGRFTTSEAKTAFLSCEYEEVRGKEAWNFERTGKGEAMLDAIKTYKLCRNK